MEHAVALHYKPRERGFHTRNFLLKHSARTMDLGSTQLLEYQEYFLGLEGIKPAGAYGWQS
jgi:hypothetical protein